jgi:hypothetical protein
MIAFLKLKYKSGYFDSSTFLKFGNISYFCFITYLNEMPYSKVECELKAGASFNELSGLFDV